MVEVLAKFRTKIDFRLFQEEWIKPVGYNFEIDRDLTLTDNGLETYYYAYTPILEIGKKYLISYEIKNMVVGQYSWVQFSCGNINGVKRYENGKYEEYFVSFGNGNFGLRWQGRTTATITNVSIEEVGYTTLDCDKEISVQINLGVNDVREINSKMSNYSNEIVLPSTPTNNKFFKYVFNINTQNIFNINAKTPAILRIDGLEYKTGFIKLEKIVKKDTIINYEIVFYGETANLFAETNYYYLKDLDFRDINHIVEPSLIINSWEGNSPYVYPYICYGDEPLKGVVGSALDKNTITQGVTIPGGLGLTVADLYPAINLKYLIDKIFSTFGYTYTSNIFNKPWFSKIFIPFTNDEDVISSYYLVAKMVFNTPQSINYLTCNNYNLVPFVDYNTGKYYTNVRIVASQDGIPSRLLSSSFGQQWITLPSINFNLLTDLYRRVNNEFNFILNYKIAGSGIAPTIIPDPQFLSNIIPGCYLTKKSGRHKLKIRFSINNMMTNRPIKIFVTRIPTSAIYETGVYVTSNNGEYYKVNNEICELVHTLNSSTNGFIELEKEIYCEKNENIGFKFVVDPTSFSYAASTQYWWGIIDYIEVYEFGYGNGCFIDFKNVVPQELKINDFLNSLIKLFNLYIEETDIEKHLNIQTYEDYYNLGETKDFTYKLDKDSIQEIEFPSDYFTKNIIFKYADSDDTWNKYFVDTKDYKGSPVGYGGKLIKIDNEFIANEIVIENLFAPTVLRSYWIDGQTILNSSRITYSSIENYNYNELTSIKLRKTKTKPRILFYNKQNIFDNQLDTNKIHFRFEYNQYTYYPYIGHILYPYNMTNITELLDLNYDTLLKNENGAWSLMFIGYPVAYVTKNNLYNLFWGKYITNYITKDSRILKAKFFLNKNDVLKLKMSDKIILNDSKYIINKINNLDLECKNLVEIELLKIENIKFNYKDDQAPIAGGSIFPISPFETEIIFSKKPLVLGKTSDSPYLKNVKTTHISSNLVIIDLDEDDEITYFLNDEGSNVIGEMFFNQGVNDAGENIIWDLGYTDGDIVEDGNEE